jgi:hypothetical protein
MKSTIYLTVLSVLCCACISLPFGKERIKRAQTDTVLYRWIVPGSYNIHHLGKPINIDINGKNVGQIQESNNMLWFISEKSEKVLLWSYSDYSNLEALAQSKDELTLRLYHFHGLIFNNFYVTEFSILSHKAQTYKLEQHDSEVLQGGN